MRQVVEVLDHLLHGVDDVDCVAAWDAEDVEQDRVFAVDRDGLRLRGPAVLDLGDVTDEHGSAVDDLDRRLPNRLDLRGYAIGVDVRVEVGGDEFAGRQERVRSGHGLRHVDRREVARLGLEGIDDDVDLPQPSAVGRGAGHSRDAFEEGLDVVERVVVELRTGVSLARHDDLARRSVRRVVLKDERGQDAEGLRDRRHGEAGLRLNERLRAVQVRAPLEPDVDDAEVVAGKALYVIHTRGRADVLLEAPADGLFDVLGRKPGRQRADDQHGRRQLRKGVDAHPGRHDACEHHERHADHQDRDRIAKCEAGHGCPSFLSLFVAASLEEVAWNGTSLIAT